MEVLYQLSYPGGLVRVAAGGAGACGEQPSPIAAAIAAIASRGRPPRPTALMKPWTRSALAAQRGRDAGVAQRGGVVLALVAQRVEARGDDVRRRQAGQVLGEDR